MDFARRDSWTDSRFALLQSPSPSRPRRKTAFLSCGFCVPPSTCLLMFTPDFSFYAGLRRSVLAVSHRLDGLLHRKVAGLLHPAADPGIHRVSCPGRARIFPAMPYTPRRSPPVRSRTASPQPLPARRWSPSRTRVRSGLPGLRVLLRARVRHVRPVVKPDGMLSFLGFRSRLRSFGLDTGTFTIEQSFDCSLRERARYVASGLFRSWYRLELSRTGRILFGLNELRSCMILPRGKEGRVIPASAPCAGSGRRRRHPFQGSPRFLPEPGSETSSGPKPVGVSVVQDGELRSVRSRSFREACSRTSIEISDVKERFCQVVSE
jgi:hypothetical protein